jgi:hypothetical protein
MDLTGTLQMEEAVEGQVEDSTLMGPEACGLADFDSALVLAEEERGQVHPEPLHQPLCLRTNCLGRDRRWEEVVQREMGRRRARSRRETPAHGATE